MSNLEVKIINLKLAMKKGRTKDIIRYKYQEYMKYYDNLANPSITQKINHRDLFYDYTRYMMSSGDGKIK
jgi:hypothetical protein